MTNLKRTLRLAICAVGASACWCGIRAAEPVQALEPYTIVGRLVDYNNSAFDGDSDVVLTVKGEDGAVLAQTRAYTPNRLSTWNFRVAVPVASQRIQGYAAPSNTLTLTAKKGDEVFTGLLTGDDRYVLPGGSVAVRVVLSLDADGNGIADVYEKSKYNWMKKYRITGAYDPNGDYDNDGFTNYEEYLAGTDPFSANDRLGISDAGAAESDDLIKVTVEVNAGRSYAVRESESLEAETANWQRGRFKESPEQVGTQERFNTTRSEWELKTIYLLKQGSRRFYKVELEQ